MTSYRFARGEWFRFALGLVIALLLLAGLGAGVGSAAPPVQVGPNVRANQDATDQQQEPSLAIDPANPNNVLVAAKDWRAGTKQVWHYRSTDGGTTWADSYMAGLPADLPNQSDPVVDWAADGTAYTSVIGYDQEDLTKGGLFVARSTDAGATWQPPVWMAKNSDRIFNDKEWMTVDRSTGATKGNVYVSWTLFTTLSANEERGDIVVSRSTDGGQTFSAPLQLNALAQDDNQGSFPVVGPDGTLYVAWFNSNAGRHLYIARSTDGGQSFTLPVKIADVTRPPSPLPGSAYRMFVLPQLTINPQTGTLAIVWNDYGRGNADALIAVSRDNGRTWTAPRRLNDDPGKADQFFPAADYGPDGVLHVAWLDRRGDPNNLLFGCYYTQSTDDGATFAPNIPLSNATSDPSIGFEGTLIGDYIQIDSVVGSALVAWVDSRAGSQDIYTARVSASLPEPPGTTPTPLPPGGTVTPPPATTAFADPAFARAWERADGPVAGGSAGRGWTWGPAGFATLHEPYAQSAGGTRLVQYFDKARMEINNPQADPTSPFYVTNGLLVVELISGRVQVGDEAYDPTAYPPAQVPVAGDVDSPDVPTYGSLAGVASLAGEHRAPDRAGQVISETLNRAGQVGQAGDRAALGLRLGNYQPGTGHNIADVFWRFMTAPGPISVGGTLQTGPIFDWVSTLGYPITEPYWIQARVAGQDQWLLLQAFQRRVLTYNAANAPAWQVEMGNVGRHYYDWRYTQRPPRGAENATEEEREREGDGGGE
jgi:hypothetical protein